MSRLSYLPISESLVARTGCQMIMQALHAFGVCIIDVEPFQRCCIHFVTAFSVGESVSGDSHDLDSESVEMRDSTLIRVKWPIGIHPGLWLLPNMANTLKIGAQGLRLSLVDNLAKGQRKRPFFDSRYRRRRSEVRRKLQVVEKEKRGPRKKKI